MKLFSKIFILICLSTFAVNCGKKGKKSGGSSDNGDGDNKPQPSSSPTASSAPTPTETPDQAAAKQFMASLAGIWSTPCQKGFPFYHTNVYEFTGTNTLTVRRQIYAPFNCTKPEGAFIFTGNFSDAGAGQGGAGRIIGMTRTKLEYVPYNKVFIGGLALCNKGSPWAQNVRVEITPTLGKCPYFDQDYKTVGATTYQTPIEFADASKSSISVVDGVSGSQTKVTMSRITQ